MLSTVSWHDFLVAIITVLVIYYAVLVVLFYRDAITKILREGWPKQNISTGDETPFESTSKVLTGLTTLFEQAAERKYHREELMQALHGYLKNCGQFKDTSIQLEINNHIDASALSVCNISLDNSDIRQLW